MSTRLRGFVGRTFALLLLVGIFSIRSQSQTLPPPTSDDQLGMLPYQSYHGGDIDSIGLGTGNLSIDLPFLVYPQRGKLHLSFNLFYNDQGQHQAELCVPHGSCSWPWGYKPIPSPLPLERSDPYVGIGHQFEVLGTTASVAHTGYTIYWDNWTLQTADGSKHPLGNQGTMTETVNDTDYEWQYGGPFETLDATAWRVNGTFTAVPTTWTNVPPTSIIDADGVLYDSSAAYEEDPNGNKITESSGIINDSLGRQIPLPPTSSSSSNTTTSGCPQTPLPVAFAVLWSPPGPNGVTVPYKFCYASVAINIPPNIGFTPSSPSSQNLNKLQSILLPNGQTWNFSYNDPGDGSTYNGSPVNYGTLTQITLPTGGTISYSYTTETGFVGCQNSGRWVSQRTVNANDSAGPHTWSYSYAFGSTPTTTVTDPLGNYAVHTFGLGVCGSYETQAQYYQAGGALLKTVATVFSYSGSKNVIGGYINVVPTKVTTTWPNNQTAQVAKSYDSGFSFTDFVGDGGSTGIYGKMLTETDSDYGPGTPGSTLRTTTNTYQALNNSTYLTNNFLNLPASVTVSGGSQTAYTTYGYDETALVSSGVSTQHDSSPPDGSARGNQTSIHRQLNNGSATATQYCPAISSGGYLVSNITYYDTGTVSVSKDSCSLATTYLYSSTYIGAFPTTITNAKNQSTVYTYDFDTGLLLSAEDPNLQTTSYTYDSMWRLASATYPDGGSATVTRQETTFPNTATLTKKITSAQNLIETNVFDGVGRVSQSQLNDPQGTIYADTTYDGDGRKASVSNPYRTTSDPTYGVTSYVYDGIGRTCVVVPPDGTAVAGSTCPATQPSNDVFTTYAGNQTTVTDQQGKSRESQTDGLGRLTNVWESPSGVNFQTTYAYDALDDLVSVVQGTTHNRSFVYDSLKRLTSSTNPETGTTPVIYAYDANGNVVTKTDARGTVINYSPASNPIDQLNRVTSKTYSDGTPTVVYSYDGNTPSACSPGGFTYTNAIGRRTGMCDADGSEFWSYDPMGRESAEQRTSNGYTKTTGYIYDLNGDLATLTYPSGRVITYVTDSAGRPSSAEDVANNIFYMQGTCANGITSLGVCYAPQGAISSANVGPTGGSTWLKLAESFNTRLQPNEIQYSNQAGNLMLLQYSFLDASSHNNGNVMGITNLVDGTRSQQFTYDQLNRLLTAETTSTYATSPAHCWGEAYVYDNSTATPGEFGNLTNINVASTSYNGCTQESLSVTASAANQITAFGYDASGNTLNDTHNSYTWNAESETKTAAGVNYTYDGDGDRVQKSNGKIYWYGAGTEILDESDGSGNITDEYVFFGGKRIAHRVVSGNAISYYGEDFLGTSRQIYTSTSTVCYDADFYPFGGERIVTNTCAQNYKFEGKERDTETNNDDFGARYYSSAFGRWTSPDWSAIPEPVPYANLTSPQTLNLYAMASDNPETFADLDGHCGMDIGCWISVGIGIANGIQRDGGIKPYAKNLAIGAAKGAGKFALNSAKAVAAGTSAGTAMALALMPGPKALQPSNQTQAQASTGTQIGLAVATAVVPAAAEGSATAAGTTVESDVFFHYGYMADVDNFAGGLRPGSFATTEGNLTGAEAQSGLALPHETVPNAAYPVTPTPGTPIVGPTPAAPANGQPGGLPEVQFPQGTGPGTVGSPRPVPPT
jgi:RHS repeat-associated protein